MTNTFDTLIKTYKPILLLDHSIIVKDFNEYLIFYKWYDNVICYYRAVDNRTAARMCYSINDYIIKNINSHPMVKMHRNPIRSKIPHHILYSTNAINF